MPAPIAASTPREREPWLTSSRAIFSRKTDTGSARPGASMVTDSRLTVLIVPMTLLGEMSGARMRTRIPGVSERSRDASSPAADTDENRQARVSKASALPRLMALLPGGVFLDRFIGYSPHCEAHR